MLPDDSTCQELHLNTATSNLTSYQILGIAKEPKYQHHSFMYNSVSSEFSLSVFLRKQGKHFIFLKKSYESISELQNWWVSKIQKWEQFEVAPLHFEQIFTIPLISKNNEFAEAYLDVRSHHPFLPVSDLLAHLSKLSAFFQPSSLSTGTGLVLSCRTSEAMKMAGSL